MRSSLKLLIHDIASYLLRDTFKTNLAAGSVNNTAADTGQKRTVTDTNSKLSISGNVLSFATGGVGANDPQVVYGGGGFPRTPGMVFLGTVTPANAVGDIGITLGGVAAGTSRLGIRFNSDGTLRVALPELGVTLNTGFTYVGATAYQVAVVIRGAGSFMLVKGGIYTNWTMIYSSDSGSNAQLFPNIAVLNGTVTVFTFANGRIPNNFLFIAVPTASDSFNRANGALGSTDGLASQENKGGNGIAWTGATWVILSNVAVNTPVLGAEQLTNGDFETWTTATNAGTWNEGVAGTSTINREASIVHAGSFAARMDVDASANNANLTQGTATIGVWYVYSAWFRADSGTTIQMAMGVNGLWLSVPVTAVFGQYFVGMRATAAQAHSILRGGNTASHSMYIDDASVKPITLSSLFAGLSTNQVSDVHVFVGVTLALSPNGTNVHKMPAGLVMNLDSIATPANFIIAYIDGVTAKLEKCVAGTYTTLVSAVVTYVAGAQVKVIKFGTKYTLLYNNIIVGTVQTVSDAGIISNTIHGLFSTYAGNTLDDFNVFPTGGTFYTKLDGV